MSSQVYTGVIFRASLARSCPHWARTVARSSPSSSPAKNSLASPTACRGRRCQVTARASAIWAGVRRKRPARASISAGPNVRPAASNCACQRSRRWAAAGSGSGTLMTPRGCRLVAAQGSLPVITTTPGAVARCSSNPSQAVLGRPLCSPSICSSSSTASRNQASRNNTDSSSRKSVSGATCARSAIKRGRVATPAQGSGGTPLAHAPGPLEI